MVEGAALEKRCAQAPWVRIPPSPPRSHRGCAGPCRPGVPSPAERSPRGLGRRTGNAVWGNPSRVRNPSLSATPPVSRTHDRRRADGVAGSAGRVPCYEFPGRARRGTSGALYLQSAPAGLNSLPRSSSSRAAGANGAEDRVPRSGDTRTASGPEGSSAKRGSPGAAARPGLSRSCRWARGRPDRRRVHGNSRSSRPARAGEARDRDPNPSGALSPLAIPALRRHRRPGGRGRDAAQRPAHGPHRPRVPLRRPSRDGQDLARQDRREGRQLPEPGRRRAVRRVPVVQRDPRGPRARRHRARRGIQQPRRRHPRAAASHLHGASRPADQGLHRRRGAADHAGLGRPPQDARGAAPARALHLLHDRQQPDPAGRDLPGPALRLPAAGGAADRGQAAAHPRGRRASGRAGRDRAGGAAGGRRDARCRIDPRPAPLGWRADAHGGRGARPARPRRLRVRECLRHGAGARRCRGGDRRARRHRGSRTGPSVVHRPGGGRDPGGPARGDARWAGGGREWGREPAVAGPVAALGTDALARAARRLAAVDPASAAPGGMRFQLELALLAPSAEAPAPVAAAQASAAATRARPATAAAPAPVAAAPARVPAHDAPAAGLPAPAEVPTRSSRIEPGAPPSAPSGGEPAEPPEPPRRPDAGAPRPAPAGQSGTAATPEAATPSAAATSVAPEAARPSAAPDDPLAELRRRWPEVVALISRHPPTKPLIEACRPVAVDGATVTLGFPESQAFLRDVADRRRASLEEGLARILGRPVGRPMHRHQRGHRRLVRERP